MRVFFCLLNPTTPIGQIYIKTASPFNFLPIPYTIIPPTSKTQLRGKLELFRLLPPVATTIPSNPASTNPPITSNFNQFCLIARFPYPPLYNRIANNRNRTTAQISPFPHSGYNPTSHQNNLLSDWSYGYMIRDRLDE